MAFQPMGSFSDLVRPGPFIQNTPFADAAAQKEALGAGLVNAGLNIKGELLGIEEQGRNLLEASRIAAESAERINRNNINARREEGRRLALLGLSQRFAGSPAFASQVPSMGLGGLGSTISGIGSVFGGLTNTANTVTSWNDPAARAVAAGLSTVPPMPRLG